MAANNLDCRFRDGEMIGQELNKRLVSLPALGRRMNGYQKFPVVDLNHPLRFRSGFNRYGDRQRHGARP
jgi:hypothetical protein